MGYGEVFQALGGGLAGLLGVAVVALWTMLLLSMNSRLKDRDARIVELKEDLKGCKQEIRDLTAAVNRQTDVIEAWTPAAQRRAVR